MVLKEQIDAVITCVIVGRFLFLILAALIYWSLGSKEYQQQEENPQPVKRTYTDSKYKPVREWINKLPPDVYQAAIDRCSEQNQDSIEWLMNHETRGLQASLMIMFDWDDTKEGADYWKAIVDKYSLEK